MNRSIWIFLIGLLLVLGLALVMQKFVTVATPPRSAVPISWLVLDNVSAQLDLFREHCGRYPTTEEGLTALLARPQGPGMQGKMAGALHQGRCH